MMFSKIKICNFRKVREPMDKKSEISFNVGTSQFRINETVDPLASIYYFYSQIDLEQDLSSVVSEKKEHREVRTREELTCLKQNDIVFSLVSGRAAIVSSAHEGFFYSQNFVVIKISSQIDKWFLVYLLNENKEIRRQFQMGLQGSKVLKYSVSQLRTLIFPTFPTSARQKIIGDVYRKQLHLQALVERKAKNETLLRLNKLEGTTSHE